MSHHTSEELYQALFEQAADGIFITNSQGRCLEVNQQGCTMLGYSRGEILELSVPEIIAAEDLAHNPLDLTRLSTGEPVLVECRLRCRDGRLLPVEIRAQSLPDGRLIGHVRDISVRQQAEEKLQASEQTLKLFVDYAPAAIAMFDRDMKYIAASRRYLRDYHLADQILVGRSHYDIFPEIPERWQEIHRRCLAGAIEKAEEDPFPREDGTLDWVRWEIHPWYEQSGEIGGIILFSEVITERKQAEATRQISEARLAGIIASAMDAIILVDEEQRIVLFNTAAEKMFGYAAAEIVGQPLDRLIPERFREAHHEHMHAFERTKASAHAMGRSSDIAGRRANGEEFPLESSISQIEVAGVKFYTVIYRNITERKRAEEELRESEASLKFSQQVAQVGHWIWDISANQVTWSDEMYRIFGLNPDNFTGDLDKIIMEAIHPDDREKVIQSNNTVLTEQKPAPLEYRVIWPDQSVHTVWAIPGGNVIDANGKILKLMGIVQDITERKQAEEALREMADNMAAAQRIAHFGSWEVKLTPDLEVIDPNLWSDECYRIFGFEPGSVEATQELFRSCLHPDDREIGRQMIFKIIREGTEISYEYRTVRSDGSIRYLHDQAKVVLDEHTGRPVKVIGTVHDITERKQAEEARRKLEEQLRQAHKMESVGRLAGGVAHDFNNLLTVIQGYCGLMELKLTGQDSLLEMLAQVQRASDRAASLTRQLLAFSRKQVLVPTRVDLNDLVTQLHKMLGRLIGEDITLTMSLQPGLWSITADPGQIEQVIMNLAANARDAMPTGGWLTLETHNVHLDASFAQIHPEAPLGQCTMLAVTDTGHGMDVDTLPHIFEPFFTTKEIGQGTGLGLATVYGIIKQSGGEIMVYSEPGLGTTFKIYFPAYQTAQNGAVPETSPASRGGTETILLVEDEEVVCRLVERILKEEGYTVLQARDGKEALSLASRQQEVIDLLLTDVVMPEMSGRELAERLQALHPHLKLLFMSGYTDDAVVRYGILTAEIEFLSKPFSPNALTSKVRQVLDR